MCSLLRFLATEAFSRLHRQLGGHDRLPHALPVAWLGMSSVSACCGIRIPPELLTYRPCCRSHGQKSPPPYRCIVPPCP